MVRLQYSTVIFGAIIGLSSPSAFAVFGEYLDPKEHIPQTCKLTIDAMEVVKTPVQLIEIPEQKPRVVKLGPALPAVIEKDYFFCSSTLIAPNALASASHCYWPLFETQTAFEPTSKPVDTRLGGQSVKITTGFTLKQKIISHARATCPGVDGKEETRTLIWQNGWPNPDFAFDGVTFDAAIFRTQEAFKTPPISIAKNLYETTALLRNWQSCRFFGYGRNNEGTSGILHGAKAYQFSKVTDHIIEFPSSFNAVGSGDSGGTLVCKNPKGQYVLVGVVSQGTIHEPIDFVRFGGGNSRFTPLGFGANQRWVQTVLNKLPVDYLHSGKHDDKINKIKRLDYVVTPFQFYEEIPGLMKELKDCLGFYRSFFSKRESKELFQGYDWALEEAEAAYNDIANEYQGYNQGQETLYIHELKMMARRGNRGEVGSVLSLQLGRSIPYHRSLYQITYPRLRMQDVIKFLRTEVNACFNNGLTNDGYSRSSMRLARKWMEERINREVDEYNRSFEQ